MQPQLVTSINHPPTSRLGTPLLVSADASDHDDLSPDPAPPQLAHDLHTEDLDSASPPAEGALWAAHPSHRDVDAASATPEVPSAAPDFDDETRFLPALGAPLIDLEHTAAPVSPPPVAQPSPPRELQPTAAASPPPVPAAAGGTLRTRMRSTLLDEEDSEEDEEHAVRKVAARAATKKTGATTVGKYRCTTPNFTNRNPVSSPMYRVAADSDGEESDEAQDVLVVDHDDDLAEFESIMRKNRPVSALPADQAVELSQEVAAAHAEDIWKPISIWSQAKPASVVKSQLESSVMLSSWDVQLLQTAIASPQLRRSAAVRPPREAPAASRMTQLPPDRGRKWPLNNLFAIKAQRKALSGVQLTAADAGHLQDIELCIAQGGQIADELRDVRAKLHKLQQQPPGTFVRAATQLKSSHTVADGEVRSMQGDTPHKNPFLPPNYRGHRAAATGNAAVPYDCIRLLQSYDTKAGTAQRLQEHDSMMSDL
jgi:hypothetical protein